MTLAIFGVGASTHLSDKSMGEDNRIANPIETKIGRKSKPSPKLKECCIDKGSLVDRYFFCTLS